MKHITALLTAALLATPLLHAADGHDHGKAAAGPNGGRVVEIEGGHAEFFVQPDKKVRITLLSDDLKAQAAAEQVVTATAEAPAGKAKLAFTKSGEFFVSETALPEGDGYRVVLQIKASPEAKPQNFRIDYHAAVCGECKLAEYACTCAGHGGGAGGHAH